VATTPVLFSSLSRLQNDDAEFKRLFFRFQKIVGLLVIPLGVGIYCYSDLITAILLGSQWSEASGFIGLWGLTSAITIVLSHYASEVYRAKGLPRLSVLAQWLHIIVLWPVVLIAVKYGFETLYIARSWVRIELILVNLVILYKLVRVSVFQMINNLIPTICASIGMFLVASCLHSIANGIVWQLLSISLCVMSYFVVIWLFPTERKLLKMFITKKNLI
jgi:PST family polysaccharide transporter